MRNAAQPRHDACLRLVVGGAKPEAQERLLHHVVGIGRLAYEAEHESAKSRRMPRDQRAVRLRVALAHPQHEIRIVVGSRLRVFHVG